MRTRQAPLCPSCERPVTDGAALCPYCGEPLAGSGRLGRAAPALFFLGLLALCAIPAACFDFPLALADLRMAVADLFGLGVGDDVWRMVLRGLALLLVFLPIGRPAVGVPLPPGVGEIAAGILWRLLLLVDGALIGTVFTEGTAWPACLFGLVVFDACAFGVRLYRLGWQAFAALLLVGLAAL